MSTRGTVATGAAVLAAAVGTFGCGGPRAGTVQVTNDTGTIVTVVECPGLTVGCPAGIGRQQLGPGGTADFAPRPCSDALCADVVVLGYEGAPRCAPVPPNDGKHRFLILVTTLPTSGCRQFAPFPPPKVHDNFP